MGKRKIYIGVVLALIIIAVFILIPELSLFSTLENIKSSHQSWLKYYVNNPLKAVTLFILFNTIMASLPIPGISMISFLGGSLFGFFPGVIYSSVATAVGNLFGFFLGRYFLQDFVYSRYSEQLKRFHYGQKREEMMVLLSFRLFPFAPSFIASLIMGVSSLHWWSFFWVGWLGRIPMVVLYTWSGVQISQIRGLEDILTFKVISVFALLGLLPWILKFYKKNGLVISSKNIEH